MIFPYQPVIVAGPDGEYVEMLRPEIEISIQGVTGAATYIGLVDTGSDNTIFPKSIADDLGVKLRKSTAPASQTFGGHHIPLHVGDAILKLATDGERVAWATNVNFFEFPTPELETVILGHAGFLEYFTATFDGKLGLLTLQANDAMPIAR